MNPVVVRAKRSNIIHRWRKVIPVNDPTTNEVKYCKLLCSRCRASKNNGLRCSRNTCLTSHFCWQHQQGSAPLFLKPDHTPGTKIRLIKPLPPGWPVGSKGLFAMIDIQPNVVIEHFVGEVLRPMEWEQRYQPTVWTDNDPYSAGLPNGRMFTSGCVRDAASYANMAILPIINNSALCVSRLPATYATFHVGDILEHPNSIHRYLVSDVHNRRGRRFTLHVNHEKYDINDPRENRNTAAMAITNEYIPDYSNPQLVVNLQQMVVFEELRRIPPTARLYQYQMYIESINFIPRGTEILVDYGQGYLINIHHIEHSTGKSNFKEDRRLNRTVTCMAPGLC